MAEYVDWVLKGYDYDFDRDKPSSSTGNVAEIEEPDSGHISLSDAKKAATRLMREWDVVAVELVNKYSTRQSYWVLDAAKISREKKRLLDIERSWGVWARPYYGSEVWKLYKGDMFARDAESLRDKLGRQHQMTEFKVSQGRP